MSNNGQKPEKEETKLPQVVNPFQVATARGTEATMSIATAREVAEVQAGMVIAQRFPRNEVEAMDRILNACTRPTLAETALYEYSKGGTKIEGPSIRLAEVLAQNWGHIHMGVRELAQGHGESTVEAYAYDMQTGTRDAKVFQVRHWRDTKQGGYKIEDSRDIYELVANVGARRKRACILAVIPGDVVEAAVAQCEKTLAIKAEVTPESLQAIKDFFSGYNVPVGAIEKRIQRRLEAMTPGQMLSLRKIANSLKDGMSAPADWFEIGEQKEGDAPPATSVEKAKAAAKARQTATAKETPAPQAAQPAAAPAKTTEERQPGEDAEEEAPPEKIIPTKENPLMQERTGPTLADVNKLLAGTADEYNQGIDLIRGLSPNDRAQATIVAKEERKRFAGNF